MFKTAATRFAHNSTLPSQATALVVNKDLRPLRDLITAEKAVLTSIQRLSTDVEKAAGALKTWGAGEGEDLSDVLSASSTLLTFFSAALSRYAAHERTIRENMKAVRTREEHLDGLRKSRKVVGNKMDSAERKLTKMGTDSKHLASQAELLAQLNEQSLSLDKEITVKEAELGDFKRTATREWMSIKFGGLVECSEKATIVGELGKLIISEILVEATQPGQPRSSYSGQAKTQSLVIEAERCLDDVKFSSHIPQTDGTPSIHAHQVVQSEPLPTQLPEVDVGSPDIWSTGGTHNEPPAVQGFGTGSGFLDPAFDSAGSIGRRSPSRDTVPYTGGDHMGSSRQHHWQEGSVGTSPWGGSRHDLPMSNSGGGGFVPREDGAPTIGFRNDGGSSPIDHSLEFSGFDAYGYSPDPTLPAYQAQQHPSLR